MLGDIVGLLEATGDTNTYINSLLWNQIFKKAKSVRFILLVTEDDLCVSEDLNYQITEKAAVFEILEQISKLCHKDIEELVESIQPVLSRADPEDADFDLEKVKNRFK